MSQACSAAEILAALYVRLLRLESPGEPQDPLPFVGTPPKARGDHASGARFHGRTAPERDRFILSPSQYALPLYATLVEVGRMTEAGFDSFNRDGSTVEMIGAQHSPGHELMSGSLGQGLSQAGGIAYARRERGEPGRVWIFMSDGELQSGQTWEALQTFAHQRLGNLTIVIDVNGQQCDGRTADVMQLEPIHERIQAFGASVTRLDGHDVLALERETRDPPADRPRVIVADTDPCRGLPLLRARAPRLHYLRFSHDQERRQWMEALEQLGASIQRAARREVDEKGGQP